MEESELQQLYDRDAELLGEIGAVLANADLPSIEIRLPRQLAERALAAWQRDDGVASPVSETSERRVVRHRAGALGLIGLSIESDGRWYDDHVAVGLSPDLIGQAVTAADDPRP
jgi:hypothetical protein